jgi:hypothetical protein
MNRPVVINDKEQHQTFAHPAAIGIRCSGRAAIMGVLAELKQPLEEAVSETGALII